MHKLRRGLHFAFGLLLLLGSAWPVVPVAPASAASPAAAQPADLQALQLVAPNRGWVLLDQRLHWTDDGGQRWRDLTPAGLGDDYLAAARFADPQHGWLVTVSDTPDPAYRLWRTTNGGRTWAGTPLDLFAPGDVSALASALYLEFIDARTGWLVVKQATSSAFNVGTLFGTTDGGLTWTRLSIPAGAPVHFTSATEGWLDTGPPEQARYVTHDGGATWTRQADAPPAPDDSGGLSELSFATPAAGWARLAEGTCQAGACELVTQLVQTGDGGQTWGPVTLPNGQAALRRTFAPPAGGAATDTVQSQHGLALTHSGHGFDACTLPSLDTLQRWATHSPYEVWNLYIGGASVANCGHLSAGYLRSLTQQGWLFIPTWVGPQPPCDTIRPRKFSYDLATAYQQGVIEAHLATDRAEALGLIRPGHAGTLIYYDIESYPRQDACRAATKSFISGWTATLRARGSRAGVYGSPCSSYIPDLAAIPNVPDAVWLAVWKLPAQFDPNTSVWNLSCIDNNLWSQGQRLRQYAGDHYETWDGATIRIDSNVTAGPVSTVTGACVAGAGQVALYLYAHFGGQCLVKGLGDYADHASLGGFVDQISSVSLGANVKVRLCEQQYFNPEGVCQDFITSDSDLSNDPIGADTVSSLRVMAYARPPLTVRARLPLIFNGSPSVAVALPNGGFESGSAGWHTSSARGRQTIVPGGVLAAAGVTPHTGSWGVWLGGTHTETVTLQQTLGVPGDAAQLTYWQWIQSEETGCYYDVVSLWVNNSVVDSYGLCTAANSNGWVKQKLDLSAYAGSTVSLRFEVRTDATLLSSLFVDDLVFVSGP